MKVVNPIKCRTTYYWETEKILTVFNLVFFQLKSQYAATNPNSLLDQCTHLVMRLDHITLRNNLSKVKKIQTILVYKIVNESRTNTPFTVKWS